MKNSGIFLFVDLEKRILRFMKAKNLYRRKIERGFKIALIRLRAFGRPVEGIPQQQRKCFADTV